MSGTVDITEDAVLLLRAIQDTGGKFGLNLPIEVLRGARNARVTKFGFDRVASHGKGSHRSEEHWKAIGRSLVQELLVDARNGGKSFGKAQTSIYSVSAHGLRLLSGDAPRLQADLEADAAAAEAQRLQRAAKRTKKAGGSPAAKAKSKGAASKAPQVSAPVPAPATNVTYGAEYAGTNGPTQSAAPPAPMGVERGGGTIGASPSPMFGNHMTVDHGYTGTASFAPAAPAQPLLGAGYGGTAGWSPPAPAVLASGAGYGGTVGFAPLAPAACTPGAGYGGTTGLSLPAPAAFAPGAGYGGTAGWSPPAQTTLTPVAHCGSIPVAGREELGMHSVLGVGYGGTPAVASTAPQASGLPHDGVVAGAAPPLHANNLQSAENAASGTPAAKRRRVRATERSTQASSDTSPPSQGQGSAKNKTGDANSARAAAASVDVDSEAGFTQDQLPPMLASALMPFQRKGVAFAVRRGGRAIIGDDMGLGKTIQAIATCCAFRQSWPVLVVVPNSVRLVWADELERWIPDIGPTGVNVVRSGQDLIGFHSGTASFHIITYGIMTRASAVRDYLRGNSCFGMVVVDESHMIKNRQAQRTRELLQLIKRSSRVILLSGTPALARPVELYTQLEAVEPGLFGSYTAFTQRYCAPKWTPFGMDFTGASNLQELHSKLRPVMIRRLKQDVLPELPTKRRQRVQLEITGSMGSECVDLMDGLKACGEEDLMERRATLMKLYKATSEAKAEAVCEYVEDLLNGGCKFLVFGHHLAMLDALEATAVKCKVNSIRIDGGVNSHERLRRVAAFQADDNIRLAILGLNAAGVGITLTAASTVVFAELHWTPGVLVQAEDRAHRIGQKSSVNIHYLVASGTIDDIIWPSVSRKVEVVSRMCDGRKTQLKAGLSSADSAAAKLGVTINDKSSMNGEEGDFDLNDADGLIDLVKSPSAPSSSSAAEDSGETGSKKRTSAFSILAMLQGKGPNSKTGAESKWVCSTCTARNAAGAGECVACGSVREAAPSTDLPRRHAPKAPKAEASEIVDVCEDDAIEAVSDDEPADHGTCDDGPSYAFCVTRLTGRVHVLHDDGRALGANLKLVDWQMGQDTSLLPEGPLRDPAVGRALDSFLRDWSTLKATEQRQLMDQTLQPPLRALLRQRALEARTTRRLAQRPKAAEKGAATASQDVACGWCGQPCPSSSSSFCSTMCSEKFSVRTHSQIARRELFAVEKGVCQACGLDAHTLFERVSLMSPPERHQELLRAGFHITPALLERPQEGMFWQADHILPVSEGGGESDLSNYRTLCTICHLKETKRLHGRLKCASWAKSSADIRESIQKGSEQGAADVIVV